MTGLKPYDWPHVNSDFMVESTERWIDRFNEWPMYLGRAEKHVAAELVGKGRFTNSRLRAVGYDPMRRARMEGE